MATSKSIPLAPRPTQAGASSYQRDYLIRMGLLRPALPDPAKPAIQARLLQREGV